jgi:hypothetical protein
MDRRLTMHDVAQAIIEQLPPQRSSGKKSHKPTEMYLDGVSCSSTTPLRPQSAR